MPRTVRDAKLETRAARAKLSEQQEPYWRAIDEGMHVGYYKGRRRVGWWARYRTRKGAYVKKSLGIADDVQDADGLKVLSYSQAQQAAREWFQQQARAERGLVDAGPYTVSKALDDYLKEYEDRGGKSLSDVRRRIDSLIRPRIGQELVANLTSQEIRAWHRKLASDRPRLRSPKIGKDADKIRYRDTSSDPDAGRKRRHSANKVLTILKAALNHAFAERKALSDEGWRSVKPFKAVDAPKIQYLDRDECVRLVNACATDFRKLVRSALYTGCRYGELVRLQVRDFERDAGTVFVRVSKSDRPRHVVLADEGRKFFEHETVGRSGKETLFRKADGKPWGPSHQQRPLNEACDRAEISPRASFHILRHTYASHLVMNGVPIGVVASNLGHADTRITEKHYAHLAPSYIADAIRAGSRGLGIVDDTNITPMRAAR